MTVGRFLKTPKGLLLIVLALLVAIASPAGGQDPMAVLPGLLGASACAMALDALLLRWKKGRWFFPSGALLTAMIVAMIVSPIEPWYVPAVSSMVAVASKYVFRIKTANVFNPAALGLVFAFYAFGAAQNWWGALPEARPITLALLIGTGAFIAIRVNKVPSVLSFLGCYYCLFTLTTFFGDPAALVEIYRAPDLQAALFFGFFMVTDPPTSPPKHRDQIIYSLIAAIVAYAAFELLGTVYFLLAGLLTANLWEAGRRLRLNAKKRPVG